MCLCGCVFLTACQQDPDGLSPDKDGNTSPKTRSIEPDGMIVLGPRLENPYSVANMQKAFNNLKRMRSPELSELPDLEVCFATSHAYVRLHPKNQEELAALKADSTLILYDFPLDCEILEGGSYYHDPSIPDSLPTYQYASINVREFGKLYDLGVEYEILENLFIPDEEADDTTDGVTLPSGQTMSEQLVAALVETSFAMTGNFESEETEVATPITRAGNWRPAGKITAYDDVVGGAVPLKKVRVRARRWFTTHIGYTDANGNFSCNGRFKRPANYSIVWESDRWDIRDGWLFQAYYNGPKKTGNWNLNITGGKSLRFATIHRAAYRYYYDYIGGLSRPKNSRKEKICYMDKSGTGDYWGNVGLGILPDIRIYGIENGIYKKTNKLFGTTIHELGHAAHCTGTTHLHYWLVSKIIYESWAEFIEWAITQIEYNSFGKNAEVDNYQKWPTVGDDLAYSSLFIDLVDRNNQGKDNVYLPYDEVSGYTYDVLNMILLESYRLSDLKSNLKLWKPITIPTPTTDEQIDKLFKKYEETDWKK